MSFDQHWGGIWDIWYVLMCLFLKKRPSFGIIGTVNRLLACDHANVPSPCIWVNLPLNLLTPENSIYYQIVITGNSGVCAILRNFYGKVYITFQLLQFIINNYVRVRVLVDWLNLEPTTTLIFLNWYFSNPSQTLTSSKFILQLKPYVEYKLDRLKLQSYSHMHKIVQILFDLQKYLIKLNILSQIIFKLLT